MTKQFKRLSPRKVKTATDGFHADGGNLFLSVTGGGRRKSWVFRFTRDGKVTAIGLGSARSVPLAAALRASALSAKARFSCLRYRAASLADALAAS